MASEVKRWSLSYGAMLAPTGGGFERLVLEGEPVVLASDHDTAVDELVEALTECEVEIDNYIDSEYPSESHPVFARKNAAYKAANPARVVLEKYRSDA